MQQSQSLNGLGSSSYKSCASEETRCRASEPHIAHDCIKPFRVFSWLFVSVLPTKRQSILSHVFPSYANWLQKTPSSLPHSTCQNVTACFCKRQMTAVIPEEFLSWNVQKPANFLNTIFLIWHIGQVLAPEENYVHLCVSNRAETVLSYCQSPTEREPHWPVRRKKCYFYHSDSSGCNRQDRFCSVDMKCGIEILWADTGA